MSQSQAPQIGDQCHHSLSPLHQFLLDHGRSAMYDPEAVDSLESRDRIRISRTRAGRPHLVCYRGSHYEVAQALIEISASRHQPSKTEMRIRRVGRCNGSCGWAPMFTIVGVFHSALKSSPLLTELRALEPVPEGVVLYEVKFGDESSYLQYHQAGELVPSLYLRTFQVLEEGQKVQTTKVVHYGMLGGRPVHTWYTHTNAGGKIQTSQRGG